jgi:hypothetical protein
LKRNVIAVKHTKITKELKRDIYLFAMIVCRSKMAGNVFGLGEGGLVGCLILAECFCPLLPNPCYRQWF